MDFPPRTQTLSEIEAALVLAESRVIGSPMTSSRDSAAPANSGGGGKVGPSVCRWPLAGLAHNERSAPIVNSCGRPIALEVTPGSSTTFASQLLATRRYPRELGRDAHMTPDYSVPSAPEPCSPTIRRSQVAHQMARERL